MLVHNQLVQLIIIVCVFDIFPINLMLNITADFPQIIRIIMCCMV